MFGGRIYFSGSNEPEGVLAPFEGGAQCGSWNGNGFWKAVQSQ